MILFCLFILCINNVLSETSYGYHVFRFSPRTEREVDVIANIEKYLPYEHDFLRRARSVGQKGALLVKREAVEKTSEYFTSNGIEFQRVEPKFPDNKDRTKRFVKTVSGNAGGRAVDVDVSRYLEFDEQMEYIEAVAAQHPQFASIGTLGKSYEDRQIKYLTIGYPSITSKNALFIDAGIHAREWIAPAVAIWIINELTNSSRYRPLLEGIDIIIVPNLNPDGYIFSRREDPMWRKNRGQYFQHCSGVDLNRNFPYKYGVAGVSNYPCSEIYKGPYAASEREAYFLKSLLDANKSRIKSYLTLHSYGQNWVYPWGYAQRTYPEDVQHLIDLGRRAVAAIAEKRGTKYNVANSADGMYPAAGASDDYAKSIGIKYVYTIELSPDETDSEHYEFALPESHIVSTAEDVFQGILVVAEEITKIAK